MTHKNKAKGYKISVESICKINFRAVCECGAACEQEGVSTRVDQPVLKGTKRTVRLPHSHIHTVVTLTPCTCHPLPIRLLQHTFLFF